MINDFRTLPMGRWQQTLVVQKSRFIAFATRVTSQNEAQEFLKQVMLPDATHHCYAYVTADGQKSNDNGEPAGTAGLPILQAIKHAQLCNVMVVVERYFGGIKLGTGGLARAYAQAASQVLSTVTPIWVRDCVLLNFETTYELQIAVSKLIMKYGKQIKILYQNTVNWTVAIPVKHRETFVHELAETMHMKPKVAVVEPHTWVEFSE